MNGTLAATVAVLGLLQVCYLWILTDMKNDLREIRQALGLGIKHQGGVYARKA